MTPESLNTRKNWIYTKLPVFGSWSLNSWFNQPNQEFFVLGLVELLGWVGIFSFLGFLVNQEVNQPTKNIQKWRKIHQFCENWANFEQNWLNFEQNFLEIFLKKNFYFRKKCFCSFLKINGSNRILKKIPPPPSPPRKFFSWDLVKFFDMTLNSWSTKNFILGWLGSLGLVGLLGWVGKFWFSQPRTKHCSSRGSFSTKTCQSGSFPPYSDDP